MLKIYTRQDFNGMSMCTSFGEECLLAQGEPRNSKPGQGGITPMTDSAMCMPVLSILPLSEN